MEIKLTSEQINELFVSLPSTLRFAIASKYTFDIMEDIGKQTSLSHEQMVALGEEVRDVLIGASLRENFTENIQTALGVSTDTIKKIAYAVDERIFAPVSNELQNLASSNTATKTRPSSEANSNPVLRNLPPPPPPPRIILPQSSPTPPPPPPPEPPQAPLETNGFNPISSPLSVPRPPVSRPIITPGTLGNIISDKLEKSVSAPAGEHTINPASNLKKEYVADPYREPLA